MARMHLPLLAVVALAAGCVCEPTRPRAPLETPSSSTRDPATRRERSPQPPPAVDPAVERDPRVQRAKAAASRLKTSLVQALNEALSRGPESAVEVCQKKAPEIAEGLQQSGVRIGRTSHRLRNPGNAPRAWVLPLLDAYLRQPEGPRYRVARLEGNVMGYVEPVYASRMCLTCHGRDLAPSLASKIRQLYPKDQATDFDAGELRGLVWVEVDPVR